MFASNWTAEFEYLHIDPGNQVFPANAAQPAVLASHQRFDLNLVRVGLNYKFLTW
jgi:opacity protein-like surface antigen